MLVMVMAQMSGSYGALNHSGMSGMSLGDVMLPDGTDYATFRRNLLSEVSLHLATLRVSCISAQAKSI
jgi:hypothetical protein